MDRARRGILAFSMNRLDAFAVLGVGVAALATQLEVLAAPRATTAPSEPPPAAPATIPAHATPAAPPMAQAASKPAPSAPACAPLDPELPALLSVPELDRAPLPPIVDGDRLAPFYERLAKTLRGAARDHLRIGFYSDSNGCQDFLAGEMRRWLQTRWGDAGHGYLALGKPWDWYVHRDVRHGVDRSLWTSYVVSSRPAPDPYYGHGMIAADSAIRGAITWFQTAPETALVGKTISRVEISYLQRPNGGAFDVVVDGELRVDRAVADDGTHDEVELSRADLYALDPARVVVYSDVWSHQLGGKGARNKDDLAYLRCFKGDRIQPLPDTIAREFNAVEGRAGPAHVEAMGVPITPGRQRDIAKR